MGLLGNLQPPQYNLPLVSNSYRTHCSESLVTDFTDEQYTTINQSTAECFDLRVFVNCLQVSLLWAVDKDPRVETSCSWLINSCALLISVFGYYINTTMSLYSNICVITLYIVAGCSDVPAYTVMYVAAVSSSSGHQCLLLLGRGTRMLWSTYCGRRAAAVMSWMWWVGVYTVSICSPCLSICVCKPRTHTHMHAHTQTHRHMIVGNLKLMHQLVCVYGFCGLFWLLFPLVWAEPSSCCRHWGQHWTGAVLDYWAQAGPSRHKGEHNSGFAEPP